MDFIPVNTPDLSGNEKKYLMECIDSGWISSEGPFVKTFESKFASYIGREFAAAVTNGSMAIDVALEAIGIEADDEIILPSFTIISCINQIIRRGAKPILVDSDPNTWNMYAESVERAITDRTKAIMIVHVYGLPVDLEPIIILAKKYNVKVIEDAAEMHGQTYKGQMVGKFGDISTFSFYSNKNITTGEGGMVLTDDADLYERIVSLRNLGFNNSRRFIHYDLGWNLRMTNMQAALGVAQLERIDNIVKRKREIGSKYNELLANSNFIQKPVKNTNYADNIYWVYGVVLEDRVPMNNDDAQAILNSLGIGSRPFFWPLHKQPVLNNMGYFRNASFPVSERLGSRGFYLPSGLGLTDDQIHIVAERFHDAFSKYDK